MSDHVIVTRDGPVQIIRLSRPAKKNALTGAMYGVLTRAFAEGDADDGVGAHVILGLPGVFSAGNDIQDFVAVRGAGAAALGEVAAFVRALPRVAKPLIAGVDGLAVGVGTTLLFHCDLVYASPASSFRTPFVDLGLLPEAGSSLLGPARMGYARAFELLVLGEPFAAERARDAGLVNAILPSGEIEAAATAAARKLAAKPRTALLAARRLLRGDQAALDAAIEAELAAFRTALASDEARAAFQAFLNKAAG